MFKNEKEIYYAVIFTSIFVFLLLSIVIFAAYLVYVRRKRHQKDKAQFAQTLLQSQLEIREDTLKHVAKELHDNLGITASLVKINIITMEAGQPERLPENLSEAKTNILKLIADIKALSVQLDSDRVSRTGLWSSIRNDIERINKSGVFAAELRLQGNLPEPEAGKATILYRMVQELLNNAIKHSKAKNLKVNALLNGNSLILEVSDDGSGFDWEAKLNCGGAGLLNLSGRAALIKASLQFKSTPGNGTTATIELPLT